MAGQGENGVGSCGLATEFSGIFNFQAYFEGMSFVLCSLVFERAENPG